MKWQTDPLKNPPKYTERNLVPSSAIEWNLDGYEYDDFNIPNAELDVETEHYGISSRHDVCGGVPCVYGTRIPVWVLEKLRRADCSSSEILEDYPSLTEFDLKCAWSYIEEHIDEIDKQIQENEE